MLKRLALVLAILLSGGPASAIAPQVKRALRSAPVCSTAGLKARYKASVATSVTYDASRLISQINDLSGNGNHAVQGTGANKPYLSRGDNQENLLKYSEDLSQGAVWTTVTGAAAAVSTAVSPPSGIATLSKVTESSGSYSGFAMQQNIAVISGQTTVWTVYMKAAERTFARIYYHSTGFPIADAGILNLDTGAFSRTAGSATWTVTDAGGGWWKTTVSRTSNASGTSYYFVGPALDLAYTSHAAEAGKGIYITGAQVRRSGTSSTYLPTTTFPQFAGINGKPAMIFDGAASYLVAAGASSVFAGTDLPWTVISVYKQSQTADQNVVWSYGNTGSTNNRAYFAANDSTNRILTFRDNAGASKAPTFGTATTNIEVVSLVSSGTLLNAHINGLQTGTNLDIDLGLMSPNTFSIGNLWSNSVGLQWFQGFISELLIFNRALNSAERSCWEKQLGKDYGANVH